MRKITSDSKMLKEKYGDPIPSIDIEATDVVILGRSWMVASGNPAAYGYAIRSGLEGLPTEGIVYYGKIKGLGELVHESELGEIVS